MSTEPYPADNAFRILRQTLDEISTKLSTWSKSFSADTPAERMARAISAEFDLQNNFVRETLLNHVESLRPDYLSRVERYISKGFDELAIHSISDTFQMKPVVDWIINIFSMELDLESIGIPLKTSATYSQKSRQLRNSRLDLSHLFTKAQQESYSERQLENILAKLSTVDLDIERLGNLQKLSEEQALMFRDWVQKADQKIRDFHEAEMHVETLASDAKLALENYSAAQSRLDAVSEKTSAAKLVEHFQTFGQKHGFATWGFFALGILTLVGAADFSIQFAMSKDSFDQPISAFSWRFAIVAGGTAIGTYLLRLASYHRRLSVWADTVQVQLQTFASYTEQIGDEASKNQLRAEFAKRVFGDEPGRPTNPNDKSPETMNIADLSTLIANVAKMQAKP